MGLELTLISHVKTESHVIVDVRSTCFDEFVCGFYDTQHIARDISGRSLTLNIFEFA